MTDEQVQLLAWLQDRYYVNDNGCWIWCDNGLHDGYARAMRNSKREFVYHMTYTVFIGPVPAKHILHHTCRDRACINYAHVTPITRGDHKVLHRADETHCVWGHEYTPDNTHYMPNRKGRVCKQCSNRRKREWSARQ